MQTFYFYYKFTTKNLRTTALSPNKGYKDKKHKYKSSSGSCCLPPAVPQLNRKQQTSQYDYMKNKTIFYSDTISDFAVSARKRNQKVRVCLATALLQILFALSHVTYHAIHFFTSCLLCHQLIVEKVILDVFP